MGIQRSCVLLCWAFLALAVFCGMVAASGAGADVQTEADSKSGQSPEKTSDPSQPSVDGRMFRRSHEALGDGSPAFEIRNRTIVAFANDFMFELDLSENTITATEIITGMNFLRLNTSAISGALNTAISSTAAAFSSVEADIASLNDGTTSAATSLGDAVSELSNVVGNSLDELRSDLNSLEHATSGMVATLSRNMETQIQLALSTTVASILSQTNAADQTIFTTLSTEISSTASLAVTLESDLGAHTIAATSTHTAIMDTLLSHNTELSQLSVETSQVEQGLEGTIEALTGGTIADNVASLSDHADAISTLAEQIEFQEEHQLQHEMAQAACVALWPGGGWVYAVRRYCSDAGPTCAAVCAHPSLRQQDGQVAGYAMACFNSLHVYGRFRFDNQPTADITSHKLAYKFHKYNGCGGGCGPNFCCCRSPA